MKKLRVGIIGMGFVGVLHLDAISRIGNAEVIAVADTNLDLAKNKAEEYGIKYYCSSIEEMIEHAELDVIHNCTPNFLHKDINIYVLEHGIHLFSEKPLARNLQEVSEIMDVLPKHPELITGINHCYRMNPMVQEMKLKIKNGEIGVPRLVHGSYLQDHLLYETDYNWRINPEINGPSRAIADIGVHWMDIVQYILDDQITEVCSDLVTVMPMRKKPKGEVATFSKNVNTDYEDVEITTEDYGSVLFRTKSGIHGVYYVSQVSAGHGCYLNFEIDGSEASFAWNQEKPNEVWMGRKDGPNCIFDRNPVSLTDFVAANYTHLAKGHPEGWNDALRNNITSFYNYILEGKDPQKERPEFSTFQEAFYLTKLVEAILKSSETGSWIKIE
ncbi:MAG: Gfo/Idh/MocA family oxidoreductase [Eubacteriales bacterium]|nr:Gfo/Idh/MocA family oxidoreductase [Eubacteriales bacterium]